MRPTPRARRRGARPRAAGMRASPPLCSRSSEGPSPRRYRAKWRASCKTCRGSRTTTSCISTFSSPRAPVVETKATWSQVPSATRSICMPANGSEITWKSTRPPVCPNRMFMMLIDTATVVSEERPWYLCHLCLDLTSRVQRVSIVEVARFLLQQHLISARSAHAHLLMAMVLADEPERLPRDPSSATKNGVENPDGRASKGQPQPPKEMEPQTGSAPPVRGERKKTAETSAPAASSPQVNALVARLPVLLPRVPHPQFPRPLRVSPPVLAPKLPSGTLKVTTLPLPSGAGVAQGTLPIINMILPTVSAVPISGRAPPESPIQPQGLEKNIVIGPGVDLGPRGKGVKRTAEVPMNDPRGQELVAKVLSQDTEEVGIDAKRKRGRPRKKSNGEREQSSSPDKPLPATDSAHSPRVPQESGGCGGENELTRGSGEKERKVPSLGQKDSRPSAQHAKEIGDKTLVTPKVSVIRGNKSWGEIPQAMGKEAIEPPGKGHKDSKGNVSQGSLVFGHKDPKAAPP
ncbi:DNA-binding protein RFX5-like isoform X4 [Macrotis lagotis]|uniref:DNA-binding protein RFX5-like isoform X4 n=1 Tax=Macrotis lagotis TaxID=92651 RepID=UPI003D68679B